MFQNLLVSLFTSWDRKCILSIRGSKVEPVTRCKKSSVFSRLSQFLKFSPRLCQLLGIFEVKVVSSETFPQQYISIAFSTSLVSYKYIGAIVSVKISPMLLLLALFHLAEERSSVLEFASSPSVVSIVDAFLSIFTKHVDMAFITAFFFNINFYTSSISIF